MDGCVNDAGKSAPVVVDPAGFAASLAGDCTALNQLVATPTHYFPPLSTDGTGRSLQRLGGLELETLLIDPTTGRLAPPPPQFWPDLASHASDDFSFSVEAATYAVEINIAPFPIAGAGFAVMRQRLDAAQAVLRSVAKEHGLACIGVGMAPSTRIEQLGPQAITDSSRYQLLNEILMRHNENRPLLVQGSHEQLEFLPDSLAVVGAGTSAQFHLMGDYSTFAQLFNAAQAITAIMIGLAAHSPFLHGLALAQETRLLTFRGFTDTRTASQCQQGVPARVDVGSGWVRSAFEALTRGVQAQQALVPNVAGLADSVRQLALGQTPDLLALNRCKGTQWELNRAVYATVGSDSPVHGGFLRVETRAMASGSVPDVWANCVFSAGLMHSLASDPVPVDQQFHFEHVRRNVEAAIADGLQAQLMWPGLGQLPLAQVVTQVCLPLARQGLADLQVSPSVAQAALQIIEARCRTGLGGAAWSVQAVTQLQERGMTREQALCEVTRLTARHQGARAPQPVHTWPLPSRPVASRSASIGPTTLRPATHTGPTVPAQRATPALAHWKA